MSHDIYENFDLPSTYITSNKHSQVKSQTGYKNNNNTQIL